jgi:hypothetical protein
MVEHVKLLHENCKHNSQITLREQPLQRSTSRLNNNTQKDIQRVWAEQN